MERSWQKSTASLSFKSAFVALFWWNFLRESDQKTWRKCVRRETRHFPLSRRKPFLGKFRSFLSSPLGLRYLLLGLAICYTFYQWNVRICSYFPPVLWQIPKWDFYKNRKRSRNLKNISSQGSIKTLFHIFLKEWKGKELWRNFRRIKTLSLNSITDWVEKKNLNNKRISWPAESLAFLQEGLLWEPEN